MFVAELSDMSSDRWYTQEFSRIFQASRSGLEERVSTAKSAASVPSDLVRELSQELADLTKSLADVHDKLPTYDQRQYGLQIKALERMVEELRVASKPKSKFVFKRAITAGSNASIAAEGIAEKEPQPKAPSPSTRTNNALLPSRSYRYISTSELLTSNSLSDMTISDLDHCIVNLTISQDGSECPIQLPAVHVMKLTNSVLILPMVHGSILLHELTRCIVVAGCHQFRMHDSRSVHVYLSITSSPVIEHCSNLRFTGYPPTLMSLPTDNMNRDKESQHLAVQDFSHIRSTPSPHWSILEDDSVIRFWPMEAIQNDEHIRDTLSLLLPRIEEA
ncbi:hypothetical protein APHAL10511_007255 [Amanita phalloides]|nr:hypothetical protein APHAL10511_007255 [Amanita phalloides]